MDRIRIAVTGAAGQIGSVLIRRMVEFPHIDPVAICRNTISAGMIKYSAPQCNIKMGSITEIESAIKILEEADIIIHCALATISGNPKKSRLLNNAMIDNFCRLPKLKLIIHLSSISVYGAYIDHSKSTFEKPRSDSDYGRSKLKTEIYAESRFKSRKLDYYILRLGHVYGTKMDRSRQMIELAQSSNFQLPHNGDLPSNSIHVEKLAAKIIALFCKPIMPGIYNVAEEQQTWRHIFDWHTQSLELPSVKGMSEELSIQLKEKFCSISILKDMRSWIKSLPVLSLIRYPAILDSIFRLLYIIPPQVKNRLATTYKRMDVGNQILAIMNKNVAISPVYFSGAMPGKYLILPSEAEIDYPTSEELTKALKSWYERYSRPKWLPNTIQAQSNTTN